MGVSLRNRGVTTIRKYDHLAAGAVEDGFYPASVIFQIERCGLLSRTLFRAAAHLVSDAVFTPHEFHGCRRSGLKSAVRLYAG